MPYTVLHQKVQDFAKWKAGFDATPDTRQAAGIKSYQIYSTVDDPNAVLMVIEWDSADSIGKMMQSPGLAERQRRAGVIERLTSVDTSTVFEKVDQILEQPTATTRGPVATHSGPKTFDQMAEEAFAVVPSVKPKEVRRWMKQAPGPMVIDVRDAAEIALTGTLPGAINISLGSLTYKADHELPEEWRDARLHDRGRLIVVTCEMGPLGALGAKLLQEMGYSNVHILEGGVQAWQEAGFEAA